MPLSNLRRHMLISVVNLQWRARIRWLNITSDLLHYWWWEWYIACCENFGIHSLSMIWKSAVYFITLPKILCIILLNHYISDWNRFRNAISSNFTLLILWDKVLRWMNHESDVIYFIHYFQVGNVRITLSANLRNFSSLNGGCAPLSGEIAIKFAKIMRLFDTFKRFDKAELIKVSSLGASAHKVLLFGNSEGRHSLRISSVF